MDNAVVRRVVCAANLYKLRATDEIVICVGIRHYCPLMRQNLSHVKDLVDRQSEVQGFVDQFGVFMDRREALIVAQNAGQLGVVRPKTWPQDKLFSEDIY